MVADKQSFSGASNELNLAVSAVSRQVADLEAHFCCQLLYRSTRAMHLTAEGHFFLEQFKDILNRFDVLESNSNHRMQRIAGELKITAPNYSGGLGIRQLISRFMGQYPQVKISLLEVNRFVNLIDEGVDLAFRVGELADSTLVARKYSQLEVLFVASPGYLKTYGTPQHPEELKDYNCIIESPSKRWRYYQNNKEYKVDVSGRIEVNQGKLAAQFAADGHGIAQLPRFMMEPYLHRGELKPILIDFQLPPLPVSLVYPTNGLINPTRKALVDFILAH